MTERTRQAIELLGIAVALGVLADLLLRATPWGINIFLWMIALAIAVAHLARKQTNTLSEDRKWLLVPALAGAAAFAWRDSDTLNFISFLALAGALSLSILRKQAGWLRLVGTF